MYSAVTWGHGDIWAKASMEGHFWVYDPAAAEVVLMFVAVLTQSPCKPCMLKSESSAALDPGPCQPKES